MTNKLYNITLWNKPKDEIGNRRLLNADYDTTVDFINQSLENEWGVIKVALVKNER